MRESTPLSERAYIALKRDIIRCHLRPGELIVEAKLAAQYGMSKTPIREAINLLRKEGFVEVIPRRGTLVKAVNVQDVQDIYYVRMLLEPDAAVLASQRASAEQLRQLQKLSDATRAKNLEPADRYEANRLLHVAIAEASGLPRMAKMIGSLHEEVERFFNLERTLRVAGPTGEHHGQLVEAIISGDGAQVRDVVIEGIRSSRRRMIESLLEEPGSVALKAVSDGP